MANPENLDISYMSKTNAQIDQEIRQQGFVEKTVQALDSGNDRQAANLFHEVAVHWGAPGLTALAWDVSQREKPGVGLDLTLRSKGSGSLYEKRIVPVPELTKNEPWLYFFNDQKPAKDSAVAKEFKQTEESWAAVLKQVRGQELQTDANELQKLLERGDHYSFRDRLASIFNGPTFSDRAVREVFGDRSKPSDDAAPFKDSKYGEELVIELGKKVPRTTFEKYLPVATTYRNDYRELITEWR
jgi:hypothetical protein